MTNHDFPTPEIDFLYSEQLDAIAPALVKAEALIVEAEADSVGFIQSEEGERTYRYANLASIRKVVRKPLSRNGLAVIQLPGTGSRNEVRLTTILLHESGQWVAGTVTVPLPVPTPQGFGSALTYARRYSLAAMLNVCVEDDDGAAATPARAATSPTKPAPAARPSSRNTPSAASPRSAETQPEQEGSLGRDEAWRAVPYNRASEADLKSLARAYAQAKGVEYVTSDDIRRDFAVTGRLVDHFGSMQLGHIVQAAERARTDANGNGSEPSAPGLAVAGAESRESSTQAAA